MFFLDVLFIAEAIMNLTLLTMVLSLLPLRNVQSEKKKEKEFKSFLGLFFFAVLLFRRAERTQNFVATVCQP